MSVRRTITSRPCARLVCRHRPLAAPPAPRRLSVDAAASSPTEPPGARHRAAGTPWCLRNPVTAVLRVPGSLRGGRVLGSARFVLQPRPAARALALVRALLRHSAASHLRPAGGTGFLLGLATAALGTGLCRGRWPSGTGRGCLASPGLAVVARVSLVHGHAVSSCPSTGDAVAPGVAASLGVVGAGPAWLQLPPPPPALQRGPCSTNPARRGGPGERCPASPSPLLLWLALRDPARVPPAPCGCPLPASPAPFLPLRVAAGSSPPSRLCWQAVRSCLPACPVLPRRPLRPRCLRRGWGRPRAGERAEEVTAAAGPAAGRAGSARRGDAAARSAARRRLRAGGRTGVWGLRGPRQGMHDGKRHADPLAHPPGRPGEGAPAPWGWLGRGAALRVSGWQQQCKCGVRRRAKAPPSPAGPLVPPRPGLPPHTSSEAPPPGAGEGRAAQPGHPAHAKPGWQLGICFLAAWLLATERCILGPVVRWGAGGGRCLPPAPRCATRAPEHAAPRHRRDPEVGAGSGAGKVPAHRPAPQHFLASLPQNRGALPR